MPQINTYYELFADTAKRYPDNDWLCIPARPQRDYLPDGLELSYAQAAALVEELARHYQRAGYGVGNRVAVMLDNLPEHFLHGLALNRLGVSQVPVNPFYLHNELVYLLEHSGAELIVCRPQHQARAQKAATACTTGTTPHVVAFEQTAGGLPPAFKHPPATKPDISTEAAILYTSGTTGHPKGCILDNNYYLTAGQTYVDLGGHTRLRIGQERILNPLPQFHMNAGIVTTTAMLLTANCIVVPDRFHAGSWWQDVSQTRSTAIHYLGIMPPVLMNAAPCDAERNHQLRFGLGAGIDPAIHEAFEKRFGIAMIEVWGMTETGRIYADTSEPRQIHTRAFGRPTAQLRARVVDDEDKDIANGEPGQLIVASVADNPRDGFFSGYLKDAAETESVWRGNWFHTGDVVTRDDTGMLYFVERRKNIIRRSGENISAAEVENILVAHPDVAAVAVLPVTDELREEEVMACVVSSDNAASDASSAAGLLAYCHGKLAYYKLPGWIVFVETLPTTGTQKVQKQLIFKEYTDPREHHNAFDLRTEKSVAPRS